MSANPLKRLQLDIEGRLNASARLLYVPAFAVRELSVRSRIDQALSAITRKNGKGGVAVQVLMALLMVKKPNPQGPHTVGRITCRVQELPVINEGANGTQIPGEEVAMIVLEELHHWSPGYIAVLRGEGAAVEPSLEFAPKLTWDVTLEFDLKLRQDAKVNTPIITVADGLVTITSANATAIYYTTWTESMPGLPLLPANAPAPVGDLYTEPFPAPAAGTLIRAVGYAEDTSASNVAETTIEES